MLTVHERLIHWLEERGDLDRALEFLPDRRRDREAARTTGSGLKSPEFSVLVAYAKLALKEDLLASVAPRRPLVRAHAGRVLPAARSASEYADAARRAPAAPRDRHQRGGQLDGQPGRHHLRLPGRGGDRRDPGAGRPRVRRLPRGLRAGRLRRRGRGARQRRADGGADARSTSSSAGCSTGRCGGSSPRGPPTLDIGAEVERFRGIGARARARVPEPAAGRENAPPRARANELDKAGRARGRSRLRAASLLDLYSLLDIVDIADEHGPRAERRRAGSTTYVVGAVRHRRDAQRGQPAAARRPLGRPGPRRAARRPLRGAGVADPVGPRGRQRRRSTRRPQRFEDVGRRPTGRAAARPRPRCRRSSGSTTPDIAALSVALRTLRSVHPGRPAST